jgi:uncharacterized protein
MEPVSMAEQEQPAEAEQGPVKEEPAHGDRYRPGCMHAGCLVLIAFLVQLAAGTVLGFIAAAIGVDPHGQPLLLGVISFTSLLIPMLMIVPFVPARFREIFALRDFPIRLIPAATLLVIGAAIAVSDISNLVMMLMPDSEVLADMMMALLGLDASFWQAAVTLVIIAPVAEELFFRGLLMHGFLGRYRRWTAILLSAFFFAIIHFMPPQIAATFFIGIYLAWWRARTGSLLFCIYGHALNNGLVLLIAQLPAEIEGFNTWEDGVQFQPLWLTGSGLILALAGIGILRRQFAAMPRSRAELSEGFEET